MSGFICLDLNLTGRYGLDLDNPSGKFVNN